MNGASERSTELGPDQRLALALAGTVALPSPFPATGRVSVLMVPRPRQHDQATELDFFLKSIHVVSPRNIVTRIVEIDALRAVGCYSGDGGYSWGGEWTVVPAGYLSEKIKAAMKSLSSADLGPGGGSYEIPLLESAVLYVPESTPVLHRQELSLEASVTRGSLRVARGRPEGLKPEVLLQVSSRFRLPGVLLPRPAVLLP